jgi:hypothetical protein
MDKLVFIGPDVWSPELLASGNPLPVLGEIYHFDGVDPHEYVTGQKFIYLREFEYVNPINGVRIAFDEERFRPIDTSFGEMICEEIEKEVVELINHDL